MHRHRTFRLALLAVAGVTMSTTLALGQAAALDAGSLQERLDEFARNTGIPGVGAAVVRVDEQPVVAVSGRRAAGSDSSTQVDDLWHIGSITKSFTATLTARLIAADTPLPHAPRMQLDWDTRLAQLLPEAAGTPYADITVRQVLGMRAGLPANPAPARFSTRDTTTPVREQRREVAVEILRTEPTSEPGTEFLYSNAGYIVLGAAFEETLDESWETLLRDHVLDPLELSSAGFGPPGSIDRVDQPRGHLGTSNDQLRPVPPTPVADNPAFLGPAGTLHMQLNDLIRYAAVHLDGALGGTSFLDSELFRNLHEPLEGHAYASGWIRIPPREDGKLAGPVLMHNGSNTMWYAIVMIAPGHRAAAAVTTNAGVHNRAAVDALVGDLLATFSAAPAATREEEGEAAPDEPR